MLVTVAPQETGGEVGNVEVVTVVVGGAIEEVVVGEEEGEDGGDKEGVLGEDEEIMETAEELEEESVVSC